MSIAITLHLLAAVIWVGGMFFAHRALRPVAAALLEPPLRLPLWANTFDRFFPWVWASVILLPATGFWMVFAVLGGMGNVGWHVHVMIGLGTLMIALFLYVFFVPFRHLKRAVAAKDFAEGARQLASIRHTVGVNLILGLIVTATAAGGRYW